ncbi:MAG: PAS domain S-box protein [Opitutaceae bacterium]|jgi:PAS domain S-box-containing protein
MRESGARPRPSRSAASPGASGAARALKQAEAKYRAIFENAREGILQTTPEGTIITANPAIARILGYASADELVRAAPPMPSFYVEAERRAEMQRLLREHLAVVDFEVQWRRKDDTVIWVSVDIHVVQDEKGRPHYEGTVRDITELKRAEEALRLNEKHYRSLFDNMLNGYAYCRMLYADGRAVDFTYLSVNHAFELLTGLKDVVGKCASVVIPGLREHNPELLEAYGRVATTREPERFESYVRSLDMWFSISVYSPAKGHFVALFDVITERKRAEAALRESEERYRLLFENNPLPMWLNDADTMGFLAVNESAVQHYGYTREEFLAMTVRDLHPPEDIPRLLQFFDQGRAHGRRTSEWQHRRKDGTVIKVEVTSCSLRFGGRNARLALAADITEKKLLAEKFLHAQRLESIGMLAAGIAHDLNNVLAPILFAAPMLRENLSAPRDLKILDSLELNAMRGAGLVKQILGFAHSTTGELRPTQVKHLAQDIVNVVEETFPKSIQLRSAIAADLWTVQGNPTQIHQVLLNLCVNARDAMPQGGTLSITAANRHLDEKQSEGMPGARPGPWLMIEVADTGTGIAPEIMTHIWDPFFTTKGVGKGTGLGLSTVRGIITSHHGFIQVDTEVGRGTTFRVFLPAADENSADHSGAPTFSAPLGAGELILVVDDDVAIRETVAAILDKHNYRILIAGDGIEAVNHLTAHPGEIALVVTDVDMPYLGGGALDRIATQLYPDLRVLVISGLSIEESNDSPPETAKNPNHDFLLKPFMPETLLKTVHRLLHP